MNLFFDTSALVKYFHEETGSQRVAALIDEVDHTTWLSELAHVEFVSAMHRKYREGVLSAEQLKQAIQGFQESLEAFHVEPLSRMVSEKARDFLLKYGRVHALRSLDALHLATYAIISKPGWRFVVADDRLHAVAVQEGYEVVHPLHSAL